MWNRYFASTTSSEALQYTQQARQQVSTFALQQESVVLRKGPASYYKELATIRQGEKLSTHDYAGGWYTVKLPDGSVGSASVATLTNPQNALLLQAIEEGNLEAVQQAFDNGADIRTRPAKHALMEAVLSGDVALVKIVLEHGIDVDVPLAPHFTALSFAVSQENLEIVRLLLSNGANPNLSYSVDLKNSSSDAKNIRSVPRGIRQDLTVLSYAVRQNDIRLTKLLLEHGADPKIFWSNRDEIALTYAVRNRNREMVELLLDYGAEPAMLPHKEAEILKDMVGDEVAEPVNLQKRDEKYVG